jgi:hypothetical protein
MEPVRQSVQRGHRAKGHSYSWMASLLIVSNLLLVVLLACAYVRFGSLEAARAWLRREQLSVDSATRSFGVGAPGQTLSVSFQLTNHGGDPVQILGYKSGCACSVPPEMPFSIGPYSRKVFLVSVHLTGKDQPLRIPLTLFTDVPDQHHISLYVRGSISSKSGRQ